MGVYDENFTTTSNVFLVIPTVEPSKNSAWNP